MFGCLRRLGCLVIILAAVAGYYWYTHRHTNSPSATAVAGAWFSVTPTDATQGRKAVEGLANPSGPVFANLTPAEAVGYLILHAVHQFPASADSTQAMITGDTLHVRMVVALNELGGAKILGPLASIMNTRDTVELSGTVNIVRQGLAQFHVTDVRIHNLRVPHAAIPKLVSELRHDVPEGVASDALPIPLPPYIADIRIANGKVTIYKNV
jgi:hypothetical protein